MYSIFKRDYKLAEDFCRFRPVPAEEINNVIQLSDNTFVARLDDETEVGVMRCHKNKTDLEVADGVCYVFFPFSFLLLINNHSSS